MSGPIKYEAEIRGHEPPYKWRLYRSGPGFGRHFVSGAEGEAESITGAALDAAESAKEYHQKWLHQKALRTVEVFTGDDLPEEDIAADDELADDEPAPHPPTAAPLDPAERERYFREFTD
jgi:hypothetical protein